MPQQIFQNPSEILIVPADLFVMLQEKTFFLQNQETNKSQLINWSIPKLGTNVNLEKLIKKIPEAHKKIFKIYNPEKDSYVEFSESNVKSEHQHPYTITRQLLKLSILLIKYSTNPQYEDSQSERQKQNQGESQQQNKKQRSRERNIRQVIELVQKWRQFHDNSSDGRRRTLQDAAKMVGISKKSLDDYYYQLRVGEKHNFDFNAHLEEKIGVLRAFIKIHEPDRKIQGKNAKHPKKLKIIQQFAQKLKITESSSNEMNNGLDVNPKQQQIYDKQIQLKKSTSFNMSNYSMNNMNIMMNNEGNSNDLLMFNNDQDQVFWGSPFTPLSQANFANIENNYYNDFVFDLQDPGDPYFSFTNASNKKSSSLQ